MSLTVGVVVSAQRDEVLESGERDEREALHARRNFRRHDQLHVSCSTRPSVLAPRTSG